MPSKTSDRTITTPADHPIHPTKLAYSIREACAATSIGRSTLYAHIAAGRLQVRKVGGRTVIPAENLIALITGDHDTPRT